MSKVKSFFRGLSASGASAVVKGVVISASAVKDAAVGTIEGVNDVTQVSDRVVNGVRYVNGKAVGVLGNMGGRVDTYKEKVASGLKSLEKRGADVQASKQD